eukprot:3259791-Rhodomonas_salina.1
MLQVLSLLHGATAYQIHKVSLDHAFLNEHLTGTETQCQEECLFQYRLPFPLSAFPCPTRCAVLTSRMLLPEASKFDVSTPLSSYAFATRCSEFQDRTLKLFNLVRYPIVLRACYAMSGTDLGYAATAMPGTEGGGCQTEGVAWHPPLR